EISVDIIVQNASVSGATDLTFTINAADLDNAMDVVRKAAKDLGTENVDSSSGFAKVSIVGTGMQDSPGYASRMFGALSEGGINIEMITTSEIRITCIISEDKVGDAARLLHEVFELEKPE
ncbi:MAG: ACT domain-containing protein, partial [Dehalococcoidia bacterium]